MQILHFTDADYRQQLEQIIGRPAFDQNVENAAARILNAVRSKGDAAVAAAARKFDKVTLSPEEFAVTEKEIAAARDAVAPDVRKAIRTAHAQVKDFARQRLPEPWSYSPRKGVILGERYAPLDRVGVYVPGGTAPLISTVLHTVTLAAVAGVAEIVVVTPPRADKSVDPAILYAAKRAGATEIYRLGGVYAIGALAYGTEQVRKVEKIVGPGNAYVTAAKRLVYGHVAVDLVAGPSEIMVIADETADPAFVAADMLSQIEHGSGHERAVLLTVSDALIQAVSQELVAQTKQRKRSDTIQRCLAKGVHLVRVSDLNEAAAIASRFAPEHLEVMTRRPGALAKKVTAAGAVFLGHWTPEPVGDYVAGPSHVLPTGGAARFFNGLTVDQFYRRMSVVNYQKSALHAEAAFIRKFADVEGLDAHGRTVSVRCGDKE
jgi:histidinol dehydrogenase